MIKVIEDLQDNKIKNLDKNINTVISRLKTIQENLQFTPEKYDMETLLDILTQIYDDIGKFVIEVDSGYIKKNWGVDLWIT